MAIGSDWFRLLLGEATTLVAANHMPIQTGLSINQFLAFLPESSNIRAESMAEGVTYITQSSQAFVNPSLTLEAKPAIGASAVAIVVAPAAMGKSTLAKEVARTQKALLFDLAQFGVGTSTLTGALFDCYGTQTSAVLKSLNQGEHLLVLDALDEAKLRAGTSNFELFLSDIAKKTRDVKNSPSIILFSRADTAEWLTLWLEMNQVQFIVFRIEFFDEAKSREFVGKQLDKKCSERKRETRHRQFKKAYEDALDQFFNLVQKILGDTSAHAWDNSIVRSFLGYAPVLETIAEYFFDLNYYKFQHELIELQKRTAGEGVQWKFLRSIVEAILDREQLKVVTAIKERLKADAEACGFSSWDSLYSRTEQCRRIIGKTLERPVALAGLPDSFSGQYEKCIFDQLDQHPFIGDRGGFANIVFEEYLYAWVLSKADVDTKQDLRLRLRAKNYRPSTILGRLFISLSDPIPGLIVECEDFGLIYESFISQNESDKDVFLEMWSASEGQAALISLGEKKPEEVLLSVGGETQLLDFWWRLGPCAIDVRSTIRLGLVDRQFTLGPEVQLDCQKLVFQFSELEVDALKYVSLGAEEITTLAPSPSSKIFNREKGSFSLVTKSIYYPWNQYHSSPSGFDALEATPKALSVVRKLLLMFRRQRYRAERTVLRTRWSHDEIPLRDILLETAKAHGALSLESRIFTWNSKFDSLMSAFSGKFLPTEAASKFLLAAIAKMRT